MKIVVGLACCLGLLTQADIDGVGACLRAAAPPPCKIKSRLRGRPGAQLHPAGPQGHPLHTSYRQLGGRQAPAKHLLTDMRKPQATNMVELRYNVSMSCHGKNMRFRCPNFANQFQAREILAARRQTKLHCQQTKPSRCEANTRSQTTKPPSQAVSQETKPPSQDPKRGHQEMTRNPSRLALRVWTECVACACLCDPSP